MTDSAASTLSLDEIVKRLRRLGVPERFCSEQTAVCCLALTDSKTREGLVGGKSCLRQGARIHDILEFARHDLGRKVAENTRESYRKTSLNPLRDMGLITRHQLSTNDPNTFYRLTPQLQGVLEAGTEEELDRALNQAREVHGLARPRSADPEGKVEIEVAGQQLELSRGKHSLLEKRIVEELVPQMLGAPTVLYIGDTASKAGYQNRDAMRDVNLPLDVASALPDVIAVDSSSRVLLLIEAVTSSGPVSRGRKAELGQLTAQSGRLGFEIVYLTAFPDRKTFRRFVEEIAWGTRVWIAAEPDHVAWFNGPE